MGAGTQLGAAGTQIHIFDFSGPKKVLYTSWGVALGGRPGGSTWGHPSPRPEQNRRVSVFSISASFPNLYAYFASFHAYFTHKLMS